jgi:phosphoserine phosphatase RsbU/P
MIDHVLRQVPLFAELPQAEIEHLAATLRSSQLAPGTILLREGHSDDRFYVLVEGEVEIVKALDTPDERLVGVRGAGSALGEMSLFSEDGCHTASVRALTEVRLLEMTRTQFDELLRRQPGLAYAVVRLTSRRLAESENATIQDLREKNRQLTIAYQELKAAQAQIIEKEKLEHELDIARKIQHSILPQAHPVAQSFDFGALMIPARAVGGDFYDLIRLGSDRIGVVVGDVCDKGVPAALFMMLTYSLLRAEVGRHRTPGGVLRAVNRHLMQINPENMFVTLLYGVLDCASGSFAYARAGQPYPLVLDAHDRPLPVPSGPGQPLGMLDEPRIDEQTVLLPEGGMALTFSDGLSEALDDGGEDHGVEHVCRAVSASRQGGAQAICNQLWQEVRTTAESGNQLDDFVVVALKRTAT